MRKFLMGSLLGGLVFFMWQGVSWTVLPWYQNTMNPLPEETLVSDTLKVVLPQSGVYVFPHRLSPRGPIDGATWRERMHKGPVGFLTYSAEGVNPLSARALAVSFLMGLLFSAVSLGILNVSRERVRFFGQQVGMVVALGLLGWISVDLMYWDWFHFSTSYTLVRLADTVAGSFLTGLVLARFVEREGV